MNTFAQKILIAVKTVRQLGGTNARLYALYRLKLRFGVLRWLLPGGKESDSDGEEKFDLNLPVMKLPGYGTIDKTLRDKVEKLVAEADGICSGKVKLFGGMAAPLELIPSGSLAHWTEHTGNQHAGVDIKFVWEPARFGWAAVLARAYYLTKDEKYPRAFWERFEEFAAANPTNLGPNWASAQEVGLRLISLVFAAGIFKDSGETSQERMSHLSSVLATHAARIPPTLDYARAQNNNHLLTEAAALYTAAIVLPDHPQAGKWRKLGWKWLHAGLDRQISEDGVYAQHSINYQRLMLQTALWVNQLAVGQGEVFPDRSIRKLAAATCWLLALLDPESGKVPNLGSNDGAYILPLTICDYSDFRPVIQAAGRAFCGSNLLEEGKWDEMASWLAPDLGEQREFETKLPLRLESDHSWGYLRAAQFISRPSHADQLHFDLWWRGINIALDGGTYQYNADPPWRNALDVSSLHNTVTVNGLDQMWKTGQFLWLDWAQAETIGVSRDEFGQLHWATAQQYGYSKIGVCHQREVSCEGNLWQVRDDILPIDGFVQGEQGVSVRLHWLIRDGDWRLDENRLRVRYPQGEATIEIRKPDYPLSFSLVRAGEVLEGSEPGAPARGWVSPTYGVKEPALSFAVSAKVKLPTTLITIWHLPD